MLGEGEECGYLLATIEPPSSVFHSLYARFMGPIVHNLIINKTNRLEVYEIGTNGLQAKLEIPINGRISVLERIAGMTGQADMLFVVTEKERFCLLRYQDDEVQTVEAGDLHDRACRPIEKGQMVAVDPFKQVIALHMVQGLIKLIPMDIKAPSGVRFREPINRRIEELQVLDIAMLEEGSESTLAILHETVGGGFRVKTYKVNLRGKEFEKGWDFDDLDRMSRMLIAVPQPRGGILVISDESIFYYNNKNKMQCAVAMRPTRINCYCRIDDDGHRFLLADSNGCLYVLILFGNNNDVESLKLEYLGQTVIASTLTYLDNGFVYVGSQFGDAQIIRLSSSRLQDGNFIEIADSLPGSGPIVDFITVDLEKIGQSSLMACSGAYNQGGLRCIRRGANLTPLLRVDCDLAVIDMFSIHEDQQSFIHDFTHEDQQSFIHDFTHEGQQSFIHDFTHEGQQSFIFLTTPLETRAFSYLPGESITELTKVGDFRLEEPSLLIGNCGNITLQVTPTRVISMEGSLNWRPPNDKQIIVCSLAGELLAMGTQSQELYILNCKSFTTVNHQPINLNGEISAIGLGCIKNDYFTIVSLWGQEQLLVVTNEGTSSIAGSLSSRGLVRSIKIAEFEGGPWLFLGHGDGAVSYCKIDVSTGGKVTFGIVHRAMLGKGPVKLFNVVLGGQQTLFAMIDRPFVISAVRDRIVFNMTNAKEVQSLIGISGTSELAISRSNELIFGTLDNDTRSRLHHTTYPLHETATRLSHIPSSKVYIVHHTNPRPVPLEVEYTSPRSRIVALDQDTLSAVDSYDLSNNERVHSMTSTYLIAQNADAIIIGTAMIQGPGIEPQSGRILTFIISEQRKLLLISQTVVPGCVYAMGTSDGKLIATINGMTGLYRWTHTSGEHFEWKHLHSHFGQILGIRLDILGKNVAIGDLMKSVNLLSLDDSTDRLNEVARDYDANWMTEVRFVNDDAILGTDNLGNIFILEKHQEGGFVKDKMTLTMKSGFHLGEVVNRIVPGTLARQAFELNEIVSNPQLLATACGGIYYFAQLVSSAHRILQILQNNINTICTPIGKLVHSEWRSLATERKEIKQLPTFLDGDVIVRYLEFSSEEKAIVVGGGKGCECINNVSVEDVDRLVELLIAAYQ